MEQLYQPHPPYTLPCNEQGYRTTHTCELCGYEPKTKNKYREKQDHLVMKHFKEQVERDFSRSHIPYLCPTEGCGFEAKDKQGLLRHYTGKHRVIEAYLQQALAAKGVVLLPQAGVKRRRSSGTSEASGVSETSDMGTADQDKKAIPVYPDQQAGYNGYQGKIQGYGVPGVGVHAAPEVAAQGYGTQGVGLHGAPGVGLHAAPGYCAPGGNDRSYLPHTAPAGGERSSVYQAAGGEGGRYRMVQGAGYLMPGGMYLGGQGRAPPMAHQVQGGLGQGRAPSVGGGLHPWRTTQPNAGRRTLPPQHTLPDPVKIKKEVEAMMASFGLRAFEDPPVATSVTPTPHQQYSNPNPSPQQYATPGPSPQEYVAPSPQQYASPSPQEYVSPSPQDYVTPSPQEYVSPSPQEYISPSPQEYVSPSPQDYVTPSPQEYVNPSPQQYVQPPQKSPQEYVSPSHYVHPPQKSPQEYVHPSPQYVQPPQTPQDYVHHPQGSPQEQVDSSPQVYVHSPQESPQEYAPPTSQDEYTHHSKTSPYPPSSASIPSPYVATSVATSPYTPPDSQPHTPESSSSDPLEAPTAPTITPKLEPEWS